MILKIIDSKNPILRKKSVIVKKIDKKIKKLIADMQSTLAAQSDPEGIGLAAPQVGKNLKIFVIRHDELERVVVNPKIIKLGKPHSAKATRGKKEILEGCLSIPHYYGHLKRPSKITIEYLNALNKKVTESFSGFPAQIVQHEIDHLDGVLFIDHIIKEKKPLYKIVGEEYEEVEI